MTSQALIQLEKTDFDPGAFVIEAVDTDPRLQPSTKKKYKKAILNYLEAGGSLIDPQELAAYAETVGASTRSFLSAALGRCVDYSKQVLNEAADPSAAGVVKREAQMAQAGRKLDALRKAISTPVQKGEKAGTWLSQKQVVDLLTACETRKSGNPEFEVITQRDKVAIGLMAAAGLRRSEAVGLRFQDMQRQPVGEKERVVLQVSGKGAKDRVVPISDQLAEAISAWGDVVGTGGRILRSLGRDKVPGEKMSTTSLYKMIRKRGEIMGKPDLQPHDLRRTFAQLGFEAGISVTQISKLLGHANIETTQRYLNLDLDLDVTISDFVPFQ